MKNKFLVLLTLLLTFSMVLAACTPAAGEVIEGFKAGMVTDVGGVDDRSFNETTWNGLR